MWKKIKAALSTRASMATIKSSDLLYELSDKDLQELQAVYVGMLQDFIKICKENGICYMLAGGTALGAVRHKGFIPWDDDIDILMPRKDLDKFVSVFSKTELNQDYVLYTPNAAAFELDGLTTTLHKKNTCKTTMLGIHSEKWSGVHLDLFPIESVPENALLRNIKGVMAMGLQYLAVSASLYQNRNDDVKKFFSATKIGKMNYEIRLVIGFFSSIKKSVDWYNMVDRFFKNRRETEFWTVPTDIRHYLGHVMPKSVYFPPIKGIFEGLEVNLPHNPDAYLKNQYGDYMRIPPPEEREKHYFVDFSLNTNEEK